jgi:hypothetical protein
MSGIKRFAFLLDGLIFLAGAAKSVYWQLVLRLTQPEKLVARIRARALKARMLRGGVARLEKWYKAADFMLSRVLHVKSPCLARSLTVYEQALRMGLYARLCVVDGGKDGLQSHAWVEICGKPFMQNEIPAGGAVFFEG